MNNDKLIIEERSRDIGNFMVGRLLPFRKKRQVGPFTFIDHMGPAELHAPNWIDVDQHPHIGLCTFTYLLEGEIHHRDSTGADQVIKPGDVGLMSSGKGVTHTERTPSDRREDDVHRIHGYQIWIALPKEKEEMDPRFDYIAADQVPQWKADHMNFKLLAGKAYGHESPLPLQSELFVLDVSAEEEAVLEINGELSGEIAFLVNRGSIVEDGEVIDEGQLMVSKTQNTCKIKLSKDSRVLIFGGLMLSEPRHLYWNFVSSSKERIEEAKKLWQDRGFPKVPNDETYIPLPE